MTGRRWALRECLILYLSTSMLYSELLARLSFQMQASHLRLLAARPLPTVSSALRFNQVRMADIAVIADCKGDGFRFPYSSSTSLFASYAFLAAFVRLSISPLVSHMDLKLPSDFFRSSHG